MARKSSRSRTLRIAIASGQEGSRQKMSMRVSFYPSISINTIHGVRRLPFVQYLKERHPQTANRRRKRRRERPSTSPLTFRGAKSNTRGSDRVRLGGAHVHHRPVGSSAGAAARLVQAGCGGRDRQESRWVRGHSAWPEAAHQQPAAQLRPQCNKLQFVPKWIPNVLAA